MLTAVNLNDEARRFAAEVGHVWCKWKLPAELRTVQLAGTELRPQQAFSIGLIPA